MNKADKIVLTGYIRELIRYSQSKRINPNPNDNKSFDYWMGYEYALLDIKEYIENILVIKG